MSAQPRLNRLFAADGRCFDVAIDHGFFNERTFLGGIEDIARAIAIIAAAADTNAQMLGWFHEHVPGLHLATADYREVVSSQYSRGGHPHGLR
jgi:DhnA family fructose-bisphosphate aldolase class Ia